MSLSDHNHRLDPGPLGLFSSLQGPPELFHYHKITELKDSAPSIRVEPAYPGTPWEHTHELKLGSSFDLSTALMPDFGDGLREIALEEITTVMTKAAEELTDG